MKKLITILFGVSISLTSIAFETHYYAGAFKVEDQWHLSTHFPVMSNKEYETFLSNRSLEIVSILCHQDGFADGVSDEFNDLEKYHQEKKVCKKIRTMPLKTKSDKQQIIKTYALFKCEFMYKENDGLAELNQKSAGESKKSCVEGPVMLSFNELAKLRSLGSHLSLFDPKDLMHDKSIFPNPFQLLPDRTPASAEELNDGPLNF